MEPVTFTVGASAVYGEYHPCATRRPVGAALLVHGFNSDHREMGRLPERLAAAGFHVLAFDQRGFGASGGERGRTDLARALEDMEAARALLAEKAGPKVRIAIIGHSLGGSYVLGALARHAAFDAAVVAHPIDRLWDEMGLVERPFFRLAGRLSRRRRRRGKAPWSVPYPVRYRQLYVDRGLARKARREAPYLMRQVNLANYEMARTMSASSWAKRVRVPVLGIVSGRDGLVDAGHSRAVLDALPGHLDLLEHEGGHSCFRDVDADMLADACADWLTQHLGGR